MEDFLDIFSEERGDFTHTFRDFERVDTLGNPELERIGDVTGLTGRARAMARTQRERALIESREIVRNYDDESFRKDQQERVDLLIQKINRLEMRNIELLTNAAIYLEKAGSRGVEKKSMEEFLRNKSFDSIDFLRYVRFIESVKKEI